MTITVLIGLKVYDPGHDKTYSKTCVTSKDSDQPSTQYGKGRALTRISKTGVQDSCPAKSRSPTGKSGSPTPKSGSPVVYLIIL